MKNILFYPNVVCVYAISLKSLKIFVPPLHAHQNSVCNSNSKFLLLIDFLIIVYQKSELGHVEEIFCNNCIFCVLLELNRAEKIVL